jgi:plasmid stability protein
VKNITIAVPDDVYRRARIRAAERDTSVSAMVREYLLQLDRADADFERGRALQAEVMGQIDRFRGGGRLRRDEVHERDALR